MPHLAQVHVVANWAGIASGHAVYTLGIQFEYCVHVHSSHFLQMIKSTHSAIVKWLTCLRGHDLLVSYSLAKKISLMVGWNSLGIDDRMNNLPTVFIFIIFAHGTLQSTRVQDNCRCSSARTVHETSPPPRMSLYPHVYGSKKTMRRKDRIYLQL